jgi:hypothetical protein
MNVDPIKRKNLLEKPKTQPIKKKVWMQIILAVLPGLLVAGVVLGLASVYYDLDLSSGTIVINDLSNLATTTISHLTVSDLTANRLIASNADKALVSTNLSSWVSGTANQITVTDNGDGTITLATPQDIATSSSPTFQGLALSSLTQGSVLFAGASGTISQDNTNLFWDDTNNRLGIGTSSPSTLLQVVGTTTAQHILPQTDNTYNLGSSSQRWRGIFAQGALHLGVSNFSSLGSPVIYLGETGTVFGTSNVTTIYRHTNDYTAIRGSTTDIIAFLDNGNVGIGDITPDANLEVINDFMVSSASDNDGDLFIVQSNGSVGRHNRTHRKTNHHFR